ncbi:MAG: hypothetical protein MR919_06030 [Parabacteroides sp.]|nr:hypothetical protein [Parabacteroides sp.]
MMNFERIKENSKAVYQVIRQVYSCTFNELQRLTRLSSTDLCLALAQLLRDSKIEQGKNNLGVYYQLAA